MHIIAHRGFWKTVEEKNSFEAIKRAFYNGFGIETDIRDYMGKLVISHNVADDKCISAESVFEEYARSGCTKQLALNVKADGIQVLLKPLLQKYGVKNYFLFDMSIPELVVNDKENLKYYTRHSDIESECVMYEKASGVWLDSFYDKNWLTLDIIEKHLSDNKPVCIISPELHGFDETGYWEMMKSSSSILSSDLVTLCTDKPDEANIFFGVN